MSRNVKALADLMFICNGHCSGSFTVTKKHVLVDGVKWVRSGYTTRPIKQEKFLNEIAQTILN